MNKNRLTIIITSLVSLVIAALLLRGPTVPDFSQNEVGAERKEAFFNYFRPLVEQRNQEILKIRDQLIAQRSSKEGMTWFSIWRVEQLAAQYGLREFDIENDVHWGSLLMRVDIIPVSLALAQAATESAWGTSRFAVEAYNYFGQWCFEKGCGVVPANRTSGMHHEIADFNSPRASVESYFQNLNSFSAYAGLRKIRAEIREKGELISGLALTEGLKKYSERGDEYTAELRALIDYNKLSQYDAQINPM